MVTKSNSRSYKKIGNYIYGLDQQPLGTGSFGSVFKGCELSDRKKAVAIKMINKETFEKKRDFFLREVEVLSSIKGEHLLELKFAAQSTTGNIYIITNYCNGGNLADLMESNGGKLDLETSLRILSEVAQAFLEIESLDLRDIDGKKKTVIHRDIKPENILFQDGRAILADYGFAKFVYEETKENSMVHTKLGTPYYMSPQQLKLLPYSYKCDVWAMGVVTYQMIFGNRPWDGSTLYQLVCNIETKRISFPETIPEPVQDLLKSMLHLEESNRSDWKDILKHEALKGFKDKLDEKRDD